jgi:mRNA interferase RelE/StbE
MSGSWGSAEHQILSTFSARARRDLQRLDPQTRARIVGGIERYVDTGAGDVRRLRGQHRGLWRLRLGEWRVLFVYQRDQNAIEFERVSPRREAYRRS